MCIALQSQNSGNVLGVFLNTLLSFLYYVHKLIYICTKKKKQMIMVCHANCSFYIYIYIYREDKCLASPFSVSLLCLYLIPINLIIVFVFIILTATIYVRYYIWATFKGFAMVFGAIYRGLGLSSFGNTVRMH